MALTLFATRKDKPVLRFLKGSPSATVAATARRLSRNPEKSEKPVFRTTRSELARSVSR